MDWGLQTWIGISFKDYKGLGMFIEEQDCSGMEQKINCSVLAACRGQIVQEVIDAIHFRSQPYIWDIIDPLLPSGNVFWSLIQ